MERRRKILRGMVHRHRLLRDMVHSLRDMVHRLKILRDMVHRRHLLRGMVHLLRGMVHLLRERLRRHMHSPLPLMWFPYREHTPTSFQASVSTSSFTEATGTDPSEVAGTERRPTTDHGCICPAREFPASYSHCRRVGAGFRVATAPYPTQS
jgi:hypothetical protein